MISIRVILSFVLMTWLLPVAGRAQEQTQTQEAPQTQSQPANTLQELQAQLQALKTDYEQRIKALEDQLQQLQAQAEVPVAPPPPPPVQTIPGALNPAISVIGNFVGRADNQEIVNEDGDPIQDRLNLRETEIDLRAAVDPFADAVLIASMESETPGEYEVSVEEGFVTIKKLPFQEQPPLGLKLKV